MVLTNIENFADKESCDAWFTTDVLDFHLAPGDEHHSLLYHLTKLYVIGDHGPHFSANNTLLARMLPSGPRMRWAKWMRARNYMVVGLGMSLFTAAADVGQRPTSAIGAPEDKICFYCRVSVQRAAEWDV